MIIFSTSILLAVLCLRLRKIPLVSPYGMFIAFQCLYNVVPWVAGLMLPLAFDVDPDVIRVQLWLSASANVAFALVALIPRIPHPLLEDREFLNDRAAMHYLWWSLPVFLIAAVLCHFYGWHTFVSAANVDEGTVMNQLASYSKHACVAVQLYAITRFGMRRLTWLLFFALMALMIIDGSRTDFFPVIVINLMLWQEVRKVKLGKLATILALGLVLMQVVRGVVVGNTGFDMVGGPFLTEAYMGSFATRQSISAIQRMTDPPYQLGVGSVDTWAKVIYDRIPGKFAPLGGFYFETEAIAHFGYFGPAIFAFAFGLLLRLSERWKRGHPLFYLAFLASAGILFVKTPLLNSAKLMISCLFFLAVIYWLGRARRLLAWVLSSQLHVVHDATGAAV